MKPFAQPFDILDHAAFVCGFGRVRATEPTPIPDLPPRAVYSPACPVMAEEAEQAGIRG